MAVRTRDYEVNTQISYYYYKTLDDLLKGVQQNLLIFKSKQFVFNKNYNQPYHDLIIGIPDNQIHDINIPQLLTKINNLFGDYNDNIMIDAMIWWSPKTYVIKHTWGIYEKRTDKIFK